MPDRFKSGYDDLVQGRQEGADYAEWKRDVHLASGPHRGG